MSIKPRNELDIYFKDFVSLLKNTNKSKNTISSYENTINSFIQYISDNYDDFSINNLKKSVLLGFIDYKNENLQKQGEISPFTKKLLFIHLKTFFKHIESENSDKLFDFSKAFDFTINTPKRIPKGLDDKERELLIKYVNNLIIDSNNIIDYRNSLIIKLFLFCGLRKQEMINLKVTDLIDEDDETYSIYLIGKGNKEREVFIKKSLIDLELSELIEKGYVYICQTSSGNLMDGSQVYRMIKSIYAKLGIKASVHDLRHTFAKSLSYKNIDITVIKELLGHSSIQTTAIYTNPSRKRIKSAIKEVLSE